MHTLWTSTLTRHTPRTPHFPSPRQIYTLCLSFRLSWCHQPSDSSTYVYVRWCISDDWRPHARIFNLYKDRNVITFVNFIRFILLLCDTSFALSTPCGMPGLFAKRKYLLTCYRFDTHTSHSIFTTWDKIRRMEKPQPSETHPSR